MNSTKKYYFLLVFLLFGMSNQFAHAENNNGASEKLATHNSVYETCINTSEGVTVNMLNCIGDESNRQDKRLKQAYSSLYKQLPNKRKAILKRSQVLWKQFQKEDCQLRVDPNGGTAEDIIFNGCYLDSIKNRAQELEDIKTSIDLR